MAEIAEATPSTLSENGHNAESKLLTRADVLSVSYKPKIERIEVPEWGGHVFVKEMRGRERDEFELALQEQRGKNRQVNFINMRAKLVAFTACDANGNRIFELKDAMQLGERSAKALSRIADKASDLSGLTPEAVDELTKELGEDQSESSGTN